jgi:hypothetical protein
MEIVKVTVFVDKKIYVNILTDKFEMYFYVDWFWVVNERTVVIVSWEV